jgi:hypothetical protein
MHSKVKVVLGILVGTLSIIGFASSDAVGFGRLIDAIIFPVGIGFALYLVSVILLFIFGPIIGALTEKDSGKPFLTGLYAVGASFVLACVLDGALLQGTFLYQPTFHLLTSGTLEGTYWECDTEWVFHDEGYGACRDYN